MSNVTFEIYQVCKFVIYGSCLAGGMYAYVALVLEASGKQELGE